MSIDLDEIDCYSQIHGLSPPQNNHPVYDVALPRIRAFASELAFSLTLFVIGRDLARSENVAALRPLVADGHEIGNHSLDHLYDLSRRVRSEQTHQVVHANEQVRVALGVVPTGFRAPGYTVTDELLDVVRECGLNYDSSVFPCPPYFAAKTARLMRMKLTGRRSGAILDTPLVLRAPTVPYRVGQPYWLPGEGLLELPIQVVGPLRAPFIGTALSLLGPSAARLLARGLLGAPLINLELHGIDFLDSRDMSQSMGAVQPDVRVPLQRKLETFKSVIELIRKAGYSLVRLDAAARAFA